MTEHEHYYQVVQVRELRASAASLNVWHHMHVEPQRTIIFYGSPFFLSPVASVHCQCRVASNAVRVGWGGAGWRADAIGVYAAARSRTENPPLTSWFLVQCDAGELSQTAITALLCSPMVPREALMAHFVVL